jgi:hypothetical protein
MEMGVSAEVGERLCKCSGILASVFWSIRQFVGFYPSGRREWAGWSHRDKAMDARFAIDPKLPEGGGLGAVATGIC